MKKKYMAVGNAITETITTGTARAGRTISRFIPKNPAMKSSGGSIRNSGTAAYHRVARRRRIVYAGSVRRAVATAAIAVLALGCAAARAQPSPPAGLDDRAARATLVRFASALQALRYDEAHALLSTRWRAAYTPGRLALDFAGAGPAAREAAERALAAATSGAPFELGQGRALLPLGAGRAAALVAEAGGWRVDALE